MPLTLVYRFLANMTCEHFFHLQRACITLVAMTCSMLRLAHVKEKSTIHQLCFRCLALCAFMSYLSHFLLLACTIDNLFVKNIALFVFLQKLDVSWRRENRFEIQYYKVC